MRGARHPALRQMIAVAAIALSTMAIAVSSALVVLTTNLHDASMVLRDVVRSTRLAREAQVDLLMHEREQDPALRTWAEHELRESLAGASTEVGSPAARESTVQAKAHVEQYLAASPASESARLSLGAAMDALERAVDHGIRDADAVAVRVGRMDALANLIAAFSVVLMIAVPALLVLWIRSAVVRPIFALSNAMSDFGRGDLSVRTAPSGADELRRMMEQFNDMSEALERQQRSRLAHLAGVAHDLRNPLAALGMASSLLDPRRPLPEEPAVRKTLAIIHRQLGRLNRMVEDLLDASRIDAGQVALAMKDTDVVTTVREVAELFEATSDIHELQVDVPVGRLLIQADPLRLEQVLTNLVSNAIKYSPRGGVIRIAAYQAGDRANVTVSDQGIGIHPAELAKIWEPFRRMGVSTETIPGVGLGLWTSQRLTRAHGGALEVTSRFGEGTTFTLSLPVQPTPHAESKHG